MVIEVSPERPSLRLGRKDGGGLRVDAPLRPLATGCIQGAGFALRGRPDSKTAAKAFALAAVEIMRR
jgi:hypothetical protein